MVIKEGLVRALGQIRKLKEMPRSVPAIAVTGGDLATRQVLLDATQALLASRSMDALSVDEIVMRADVAKGTFYNHFSDKDALARELGLAPAHTTGKRDHAHQ